MTTGIIISLTVNGAVVEFEGQRKSYVWDDKLDGLVELHNDIDEAMGTVGTRHDSHRIYHEVRPGDKYGN